jgi:magnesium chelatase subunit D
LQFDTDPAAFCEAFQGEQERLRLAIIAARSLVCQIKPSEEILEKISEAVTAAGVRSLRADLAVLRAAMAHAALGGRVEVTSEDIDSVLPLVLHHRAKRNPGQSPPAPPDNRQSRPETKEESGKGRNESTDRVFSPEARAAPELRVNPNSSASRGRSATVSGKAASAQPRVAAPDSSGGIDVVASFTQSFRNTGTASLKREQLVFRAPRAETGVRFIFVVDSSGSHAAQQRMRAVKGIAAALLESSVDTKDEVAVISFRGAKAELVLEPCRDVAAAVKTLEFLPTGGRTPLAHALELATSLVTPASMLILLTDGRANVPLTSADPWADALEAARKLNCPCLLVDSSIDTSTAAAIDVLASAMQAKSIRLNDLSKEALIHVLRQ